MLVQLEVLVVRLAIKIVVLCQLLVVVNLLRYIIHQTLGFICRHLSSKNMIWVC